MASYKSDDSFLEKISIGAIGTKQVYSNLIKLGHKPIELERGSMSYKIWKKIKIKRIRVPDILLVDCGICIESRAKTKLEITMSHSESDPNRGWDFGLKDSDFVALVVCYKVGDEPIDWIADEIVQYIRVGDLRKAVDNKNIIYIKPKGAEEGFEARITWPSAVASANGKIKQITEESIQFYRNLDNRTISLSLVKKGIKLEPLVNVGDSITRNQIIASTVPVNPSFNSNPVNEEHFISILKSTDLSDRYAATKALTYFKSYNSEKALIEKLKDKNEHIYVKLEAAANLARFGNDSGFDYIKSCIQKNDYAQNVLESIIVLAEIKSNKSCEILIDVLQDGKYDPEIRAGAAWALGEQNDKSALNALIKSFNNIDEIIKVEAARALSKLSNDYTPELLNEFVLADEIERPGVAWALSRTEKIEIEKLIPIMKNLDTRHWVSYIIGKQGSEKHLKEIEELKDNDPEVYFAVTVLWKIMTSWVYNLKEY